jgi:peroxiredoxin
MDNVNRLRAGLIAPKIFLDDSEGKKVDSSLFLGKGKLLVVFYKGGNDDNGLRWLEELNKSSRQIDLLNGIILAISMDEPRVTRKLKQEMGLDFPLLSDRRSETISAYGVLDTSSEKGEPHPATFVVDRLGIIRYRKVYSDYRDRPAVKKITSLLEEVT